MNVRTPDEATALKELKARIATKAKNSILEYDRTVDPIKDPTKAVIGGNLIIIDISGDKAINGLPTSAERLLDYIKKELFEYVDSVTVAPGHRIGIRVKKHS